MENSSQYLFDRKILIFRSKFVWVYNIDKNQILTKLKFDYNYSMNNIVCEYKNKTCLQFYVEGEYKLLVFDSDKLHISIVHLPKYNDFTLSSLPGYKLTSNFLLVETKGYSGFIDLNDDNICFQYSTRKGGINPNDYFLFFGLEKIFKLFEESKNETLKSYAILSSNEDMIQKYVFVGKVYCPDYQSTIPEQKSSLYIVTIEPNKKANIEIVSNENEVIFDVDSVSDTSFIAVKRNLLLLYEENQGKWNKKFIDNLKIDESSEYLSCVRRIFPIQPSTKERKDAVEIFSILSQLPFWISFIIINYLK